MPLPTIPLIAPRIQLEKMTEYLAQRKPYITTSYTPHGPRCSVTIYMKNNPSNNSKINETPKEFFEPTDTTNTESEQVACRETMRYLRDHYSDNTAFQIFIQTDVYSTDPFLMEYNISHVSKEYVSLEKQDDSMREQLQVTSAELSQSQRESRQLRLSNDHEPDELYNRLSEEAQELRVMTTFWKTKHARKKSRIKKMIKALKPST